MKEIEEGFVEVFGFKDDDIPINEFLALENEAVRLHANPGMSTGRKRYHSVNGKIVSETEHFFAEKI